MSNIIRRQNKDQNNVIAFSDYQSVSWYCLIARFSFLRHKPDDWFSTLLNCTNACMGDSGARAYLFPDDEVHILMTQASPEGLSAMRRQLSDIFGEDMGNLLFLYEIDVAPGEDIPQSWTQDSI